MGSSTRIEKDIMSLGLQFLPERNGARGMPQAQFGTTVKQPHNPEVNSGVILIILKDDKPRQYLDPINFECEPTTFRSRKQAF